MTGIVHDRLPDDSTAHPLPGTRPCAPGDWLRRDERYAQQMALRDELIAKARAAVVAVRPEAEAPARELLSMVRAEVGAQGPTFTRPDGVTVQIEEDDPFGSMGRLAQEDFCLMLPGTATPEHWLAGAVLCFPSRWTLAEKIGRPLTGIHVPVPEYDENLARRVQRLFDGVKPGRPLVRWNHLPYWTDQLHNPKPEVEQREPPGPRPFLRKERQVLNRLPETGAVVFSIHTWIVPNPAAQGSGELTPESKQTP